MAKTMGSQSSLGAQIGLALTIFVTGFATALAGSPVWAQDTSTTRTSISEAGPQRLSDLGTHINPQIGLSSFGYSDVNGNPKQGLSGGTTAEFGQGSRRLEVGLLLIQAGGQVTKQDGTQENLKSTFLTIPMMAKFRVADLGVQSWYLKGGFMTAFEVASNDNSATNNLDVLASVGAGGRFKFTKQADFIIEATFNRGLLEAVRSSSVTTGVNQGVLALAGLSFQL